MDAPTPAPGQGEQVHVNGCPRPNNSAPVSGAISSGCHGRARLTERVWAAFQSVRDQLVSLPARLCTAVAAGCKFVCWKATVFVFTLGDKAKTAITAIYGRVRASRQGEGTAPGAEVEPPVAANDQPATTTTQGPQQTIEPTTDPTTSQPVQANKTQSPQQTSQSPSESGEVPQLQNSGFPGSLPRLDPTAPCASRRLKELKKLSASSQEAREQVQSYLDGRCQELRRTDEQRQLLEQFGIACPQEKPTIAQIRGMVDRTVIILKALKEMLATLESRNGLLVSPLDLGTAEGLVLRLPPEELQKVLTTARLCNLCRAFAEVAALPKGLSLEKAAEHIQRWLKGEEARRRQQLTVRSGSLTCVPLELGELASLQELDLSYNKLACFPAELFTRLAKLQTLTLSFNQLRELPSTIGKAQNLQTLQLRENQFEEFPSGVENLQKLQVLNLAENELKALPSSIKELRNLQALELAKNKLEAIPPEIGELTSLKKLDLSRNRLSALDAKIWQLTKLEFLSLQRNDLKEISGEIGKLKNLQTLYLCYNSLVELPEELGDLADLTHFDVRGNGKLKTLPATMAGLKKLLPFGVQENLFIEVPEGLRPLVQGLHEFW